MYCLQILSWYIVVTKIKSLMRKECGLKLINRKLSRKKKKQTEAANKHPNLFNQLVTKMAIKTIPNHNQNLCRDMVKKKLG